jgi:ankyrin repeat protein
MKRILMLSLISVAPMYALAQTVARTHSSSALFSAIEKGDVRSVKAILDAGGNPNAVDRQGHIALSTAAELGNLAIVNDLIAAGARVNAKDVWEDTALEQAVEFGQLEVVKVQQNRVFETAATSPG